MVHISASWSPEILEAAVAYASMVKAAFGRSRSLGPAPAHISHSLRSAQEWVPEVNARSLTGLRDSILSWICRLVIGCGLNLRCAMQFGENASMRHG